jgi:hypothetical protein
MFHVLLRPRLDFPARRVLALTAACLAVVAPASAQAPANVPDDAPARYHPLPTLRDQAREQQAWSSPR